MRILRAIALAAILIASFTIPAMAHIPGHCIPAGLEETIARNPR